MSKKHSKKRNVGLIYEFLIKTISTALLEGDNRKSAKALKIVKRYFKPGTELYNEFRLVHSLKTATVSSENVAISILDRARQASQSHNSSKLNREKSLLIREINHGLQDDNFYDQPVVDYRLYATIQTLIDEWRNPSGNIKLLAEYEDKLVRWLTSSKDVPNTSMLSEEDAATSRLLVKVMTQKLNEKYSKVLSPEQMMILREYGLSSDNKTGVTLVLENVKSKLLETIEDYNVLGRTSDFVTNLSEFKEMLLGETLTEVNDDVIVRFMMYAKFLSKLKGDNRG